MIQAILAYFKYVKIPKEAVILSIKQEEFLKKLKSITKNDEAIKVFDKYIEGQRTLTQFLRSGRLLR